MEILPLSVFRLCDTETTGFNPPAAEMCEIGWTDLILYPDGWKIEVDQQSMFVNPGHPITNSHIHGITDDMVRGAMSPADARAHLARGAVILGAHNVAFDRRFVQSSLPWVCTLECARAVWPSAPNHKNETLKTFLGIEVDGDAHRAGYDAAVSARIFLHLAKHLTIEKMIELSTPEAVPSVMAYGAHKGKRFVDIPESYLSWLTKADNTRKGVRIAAQNELNRRASTKPAPAARPSRSSSWDRSF